MGFCVTMARLGMAVRPFGANLKLSQINDLALIGGTFGFDPALPEYENGGNRPPAVAVFFPVPINQLAL
jgi:hypothetical protein